VKSSAIERNSIAFSFFYVELQIQEINILMSCHQFYIVSLRQQLLRRLTDNTWRAAFMNQALLLIKASKCYHCTDKDKIGIMTIQVISICRYFLSASQIHKL